MKNLATSLKAIFLCSALFTGSTLHAQKFLTGFDTTDFVQDTLRPLVQRFGNLYISGYIQPQFQVAQTKGAESYSGGNFSAFSYNRFMLRRARLKSDYLLPSKHKNFPAAIFTFQFDATERGVFVRDMFVRLFEPKQHNFSLTAGVFARPFGYEINLSSSYRETPERGRMSQILMPTERDLGVMISFEPSTKKAIPIKFDIGVFDGQGLTGTTDFDSYKDVISRLTIKPIGKTVFVSGGLSLLYGGWAQGTKYKYEIEEVNSNKSFKVDSSINNIGAKAPRHYFGADVQTGLKHGWGKTEIRAEYWRGTQPGTATSTFNPGSLPTTPTYIRNFDGAFLYLLQNIINDKWLAMVKYDWYDPNVKVAGHEIGRTGTNFSEGDVKYSTLGMGLTHFVNDHLKVIVYYDMVTNEKTALTNYAKDKDDNIFTLRMQLRF